MKKKPFLISIDTEGDNLWNYKQGEKITTKNVAYLSRFQNLCNKYGFKPTYLTNYEMASSDAFVKFASAYLSQGQCEIGMHLHAWNSPPIISLAPRNDGIEGGNPYITEYSQEDIYEKVSFLTNLLKEKFNIIPVTHRAGRWATNKAYAGILAKHGYKYDCSFTPGLSWENCGGFTNGSKGNDYRNEKNKITNFYDTCIIEIPLQSYENKRVRKENAKSFKSYIKNIWYAFKRKERIVLRPNGKNLNDLLYVINKNRKSSQQYLMFMLHSSEFMPGGSPTFDNEEKIEKLYKDLEVLFKEISKHYYGMTIGEFGESIHHD